MFKPVVNASTSSSSWMAGDESHHWCFLSRWISFRRETSVLQTLKQLSTRCQKRTDTERCQDRDGTENSRERDVSGNVKREPTLSIAQHTCPLRPVMRELILRCHQQARIESRCEERVDPKRRWHWILRSDVLEELTLSRDVERVLKLTGDAKREISLTRDVEKKKSDSEQRLKEWHNARKRCLQRHDPEQAFNFYCW